MKVVILNFFEQICDHRDLQRFFVHISVDALQVHQLKLFKVIFGPEEEKPEQEEFFNFMLTTHTRLFRDMGLNETHFDMVAECFVRALETLHADQDVIDESLSILGPLRDVFALGSRVAKEERVYSPKKMKSLPCTTAKNMYSDEPSVLPNPAHIDIPVWLTEILAKQSKEGEVRAWTSNLIDRFGCYGDTVIADTFMDMPYMNHHVYATAMLQLAFLPSKQSAKGLIKIVLYPRGPSNGRMSVEVWNRMISQFRKTAHDMGMEPVVARAATQRLKSHRDSFSSLHDEVGGIHAPHVLRRKISDPANPELGSTSSDSDTAMQESSSDEHAMKSGTQRRVWRRLLGWVRVKN